MEELTDKVNKENIKDAQTINDIESQLMTANKILVNINNKI